MHTDFTKAGIKTPGDNLQDETKIARAKKDAQILEEDRSDIAMGMKMDNLCLDERPDGKITTAKTNAQRKHAHAQHGIDGASILLGAAIASAQSALGAAMHFAAGLSASGALQLKTAQGVHALHKAEDDHYIYDTVLVSEQTATQLNSEAQHLSDLVQEIKEEQDPKIAARLQMELDDIAAYYNMRPHPVTGLYVHSFDYIERVERINAPNPEAIRTGAVCFFLAKADIASSRGVKRAIADVYDQNPEEVQLTQADTAIQVAAKPVPPTLTHS